MRNKEMMDVCVDKVLINTNTTRTIFIDLRFLSFDITIKNIEICLEIRPGIDGNFEFIDIEFPYTWNPMVCDKFYALEFSSDSKVHFITYIRKWIQAQPILMDFLRTGLKEEEELQINNLPE